MRTQYRSQTVAQLSVNRDEFSRSFTGIKRGQDRLVGPARCDPKNYVQALDNDRSKNQSISLPLFKRI